MDVRVLNQPLIQQILDAIVRDGGGCFEYDTGCGGREVLIAAGAELAALTGQPLAIVESPVLHAEITAMVSELQPTVSFMVLSADEAAHQRPVFGGVLAVHADVLRDTAARQPLMELAHMASHRVVARHSDSDTSLDDLAGSLHTLKSPDLLQSLQRNTVVMHMPPPALADHNGKPPEA